MWSINYLDFYLYSPPIPRNYELKDRGLMGINPENHDIISSYTAISIEVQYFIFKTKRFTENMV